MPHAKLMEYAFTKIYSVYTFTHTVSIWQLQYLAGLLASLTELCMELQVQLNLQGEG